MSIITIKGLTMKNKQAYPKYLDALLAKTFYPDTSREFREASNYLEQINKKIDQAEKGNSKTSGIRK